MDCVHFCWACSLVAHVFPHTRVGCNAQLFREHGNWHVFNVVQAGVWQSEEAPGEKNWTKQSTESTSQSSSSVFIVSDGRSRPRGHSIHLEHGSCGQWWKKSKEHDSPGLDFADSRAHWCRFCLSSFRVSLLPLENTLTDAIGKPFKVSSSLCRPCSYTLMELFPAKSISYLMSYRGLINNLWLSFFQQTNMQVFVQDLSAAMAFLMKY